MVRVPDKGQKATETPGHSSSPRCRETDKPKGQGVPRER